MFVVLSILHVLIAVVLVLVVLLQSGKGADIGAAFGGGASQTVFGGRGAATFLTKATSAIAVLFMLSSLFLALYAGRMETSTVITEERARQAAPGAAPGAPPPAAEQPSPAGQAPSGGPASPPGK
jgi:preprotein translocase subunit SecG